MLEHEGRRPSLANIYSMDYLRISRLIHSGAKKIYDQDLGKGIRFIFQSHDRPTTLDIYPRTSSLHLYTETERLELKNVDRPNFTEVGIIFQDQEIGKERYLLIENNGEIVFLLGSSIQKLLETDSILSPVIPPKTFPPSTVAASPSPPSA